MPERKRFLLRLDPATYDALERWAGDELRSVNAQIEFVLGDALKRAGRPPTRRAPPPAAARPALASEGTGEGEPGGRTEGG